MTSRQPPSQRNRSSIEHAVRHNSRGLRSQGGPGFLSGRFATAQPIPGGSWVEALDDSGNDGPESDDLQFESAEPTYSPTTAELTAGSFSRQLLHTGIAPEHGLFTTINGVALGSEWWTLDAEAGVVTVTIPDWVADAPADRREFGWPMYAYRRGLAVEVIVPAQVPFTVVGYTSGVEGGSTTHTSVPFPAGAQTGDLFVYACNARTDETNACSDERATLWVDEPLNAVRRGKIWRGTVSDPATPLAVTITGYAGAAETTWGILVIRPERPADWDASKVGDSGIQGAGQIPSLSGVSGAVGVGFSTAGTGGGANHIWSAPWVTVNIGIGTYARTSFASQVNSDVTPADALTADAWRGFALGVGLG